MVQNADFSFNFNDLSDIECTDIDNYQFCRHINDTTFEYFQLSDKEWIEQCDEWLADNHQRTASDLLKNFLNGRTYPYDWEFATINVNDYDDDELGQYLSGFGGILDGVTDEVEKNQLTAECIFEEDYINENF